MADDQVEKIFQLMHDRFDLPPTLDPVVRNLVVQYNPRYASLDRVTLSEIIHQIRRLYPDSESWQRVKTMFRAIFVLIVFENNVSKRLDSEALLRDYPEFADCKRPDEVNLLVSFRNFMIAALHVSSPVGKKLELVALAARLVGQTSGRNNTVIAPKMILIYERESNLTNRRKRKYDGPDDGRVALRTNISGSEHLAATGYVGHYHYVKVNKKEKQQHAYPDYKTGTSSTSGEKSAPNRVANSFAPPKIGYTNAMGLGSRSSGSENPILRSTAGGFGVVGSVGAGSFGGGLNRTMSSTSVNVDASTAMYITDPHRHTGPLEAAHHTTHDQEYPYNLPNARRNEDYYDSLYNPAYNYLRSDVHRAVNSGYKFIVRPPDIYDTSDVIKDVGKLNSNINPMGSHYEYDNANYSSFHNASYDIPRMYAHDAAASYTRDAYNAPTSSLYPSVFNSNLQEGMHGLYNSNSVYKHTPSAVPQHSSHTINSTVTSNIHASTQPVLATLQSALPARPALHTTLAHNSSSTTLSYTLPTQPALHSTHLTHSTFTSITSPTSTALPHYTAEYSSMAYNRLLVDAGSGSEESGDEHESKFNIDIDMEHVPFPSLLHASLTNASSIPGPVTAASAYSPPNAITLSTPSTSSVSNTKSINPSKSSKPTSSTAPANSAISTTGSSHSRSTRSSDTKTSKKTVQTGGKRGK